MWVGYPVVGEFQFVVTGVECVQKFVCIYV